MVIKTWITGILFLKVSDMNLSLQEKQLTEFVANGKIQAVSDNQNFAKILCIILWWTASQYLRPYSNEISSDFSECDFFFNYYEMCQHLKDLNNQVNQSSLNDQCMTI